jgi:hypothetical protein
MGIFLATSTFSYINNNTIINTNTDCIRSSNSNNTVIVNTHCDTTGNYGYDFNNGGYNNLVMNSTVNNSRVNAITFSEAWLPAGNFTSKNNKAYNSAGCVGFTALSGGISTNDYCENDREGLSLVNGAKNIYVYNLTVNGSDYCIKLNNMNHSVVDGLTCINSNYTINVLSNLVSQNFTLVNDYDNFFSLYTPYPRYSIKNINLTNVAGFNLYIINGSGIQVNISKGNYLKYQNTNDSLTSYGIISNLTSPLISFSNGTSFYQSGTNLEYNLTLNPNEWVYVYENATAYQINYQYSYNQNVQNGYSTGSNFISNNIIQMVVNFFSLTQVIGTILGVCILIAGIVILVILIHRLNNETSGDTIHG